MKQLTHSKVLHLYCTVHFFERFSFYGLTALLILYFATHLGYNDARSYAVIGVLGTLTYATPLLGGYIADQALGFYRCILIGLVVMMVGYASIFFAPQSIGLFFGLGLIVTGSGFYKSNMNTLIGNLYPSDPDINESAFTMLYVYQNVGAFLAPIICGSIGLTWGWSAGFLCIVFSSICALIVFGMGQRFRHFKPQSRAPFAERKTIKVLSTGGIVLVGILLGVVIHYGQDSLHLLSLCSLFYGAFFIKLYLGLNSDDKSRMKVILFGILAVALSGALLNHGRTVGTLFMERHVDPLLGSFTVPSTFVQSMDPLVIIVLGPCVAWLWRFLSHHRRHVHSLNKIMIGFAVLIAAYFLLKLICSFANNDFLISLVPFFLSVGLLASADIFIYPNVLSFTARLAPKPLAGLVMGFVVFGMSLSELMGTYLAQMAAIPHNELITSASSLTIYQDFFGVMEGLAVGLFLVIGAFVLWIYKKRTLWTFIN